MSQEIELKLSVEPKALRRLMKSDAVQAVALGRMRRQRMQAVYLDTEDGMLAAAGLGLRLRQEGRQWRQTVKTHGQSHAGLHARAEFETPAPGGALDLERLLSLQPDLLEPLRRAAPALVPLFRTRFDRHLIELGMPGGGRVELAFDLGEIEAGNARAPISEIEIELLEGPTQAVFALALELWARAPLRIENRSKAQRGLALIGDRKPAPRRAAPPTLDPELPLPAAATLLLGEAMAHFEGNEEGVLAGEDPEFLHQARVALRRLRSQLRLLKPLLPASELAGLNPPLRALGRALGACRDWDVLGGETLVELGSGLDQADWIEPLQRLAAAHRQQAQDAVREALEDRNHQRFKLEFGRLLARLSAQLPEETDVKGSTTLRDFARQRLRSGRRRLQQCCAELDVKDNTRVHALRLEIKKLRYACEALGSLFPARRVRSFVQRLAQAQGELGHFNDAAVAQRLVDGLGAIDPLARGALHGFAAARTLGTRRQLPQLVARIERAKRFW
jgi:triphosphatase